MDDTELIKQKVNIVDLISEYLPLKKSGVNFKANCPFHQEKTPSFIVSPERGIWKCFGCDRGGDVFSFLMEKEGMNFPEALENLAKRSGIILTHQTQSSKHRDRLFEANKKAAEFFRYLLTKHPLGQKALAYLKGRGLTDQAIEKFQLGYAPNSWDSLSNFLSKRGFKTAELIEVGLLVPSKQGGRQGYDRFRGRIMFPLVDVKQQILGFAGRVLDKAEPKYINTSTTPIFDKSQFLFGLNLSKGDIKSKNQAILVEGEMDMIMSYQSGVKHVVASKGTALTSGQITLVKKYTDTLLLCFDKDLAGDFAARRGIEIADAEGLNIKVVKIPSGKDPAELCSKTSSLWESAVAATLPIYDYYLESTSNRFDLKSAEGKKRIASELIPIWQRITDPITKEHYLQKLAALLNMEEMILRQQINRKAVTPTFQVVLDNKQKDLPLSLKSRRELLEEYLLAMLLKMPEDLIYVPNFPETIFLSENLKSVYVLLVLYLDSISFKARSFTIAEFIKDIPAELLPTVDWLYLSEIDAKLTDSKNWQAEVDRVVSELKRELVKASLHMLSAQIKSAQAFGKMELLDSLNKRFRDLSVKLKGL